MKHIIQYVGAGVVALGLSLSPAWALTQDEARAEIEKHAAERQLNAKDRAAALETLSALVQKGVPVERAYEVVETAIDKDIKGPEFADIVKYIEARRDEGATADTAAAEAVSRIEHEAMHEMRDYADQRDLRETMDIPGSMGGNEVGAGAGAGAGAGGGGPDMGGGVGAGAGAGAR